jgi:hypothetical protein
MRGFPAQAALRVACHNAAAAFRTALPATTEAAVPAARPADSIDKDE